jgi:hypothetical protein
VINTARAVSGSVSFKKMVGFTDRQESVVSNWRKNVVTKLGEEVAVLFDQPSRLIRMTAILSLNIW